MIVYRHCDPRFPFLWETPNQPSARWHLEGDGPTHYFADTPDGAWAEFLRHEEITDPADLDGIRRALWAVDVRRPPTAKAKLPAKVMTGGLETYKPCQQEARRLRNRGVKGFQAPSAALQPGGATGWVVDKGLRSGPTRHGIVYILFGVQPRLVGWMATYAGRPPAYLLQRVNHL